jgi:hypothetical protein
MQAAHQAPAPAIWQCCLGAQNCPLQLCQAVVVLGIPSASSMPTHILNGVQVWRVCWPALAVVYAFTAQELPGGLCNVTWCIVIQQN